MNFNTHVIQRYYPLLLEALWVTTWICGISLAIGIVLGLFACIGKLSRKGIGYYISSSFIDFFRTIPEVVIIFWAYFCLPLLFNIKMSGLVCGVIALSVFAGAFLAEIFRAGVLAVPKGQVEAAYALGIPNYFVWRHAILPPAIHRMMPAFVNFLTELIKASSLLSAIGIGELFYRASILGGETYRYMELLSAVAVLYFLLIFPLSMIARITELRRVQRTGH